MYNRVILMGRLTKDPEIKYTTSGKMVCHFSIAVDRRFSSNNGEKQADFFDCQAWEKTADFINKYFAKGRSILVEGELQNRQYTAQDGTNRRVTEIIVDRACFTGEKRESTSGQSQAAPPVDNSTPEQGYPTPPPEQPQGQGVDDYPFF